jgi:myo-inositol-1(or 4)-monophosphatase
MNDIDARFAFAEEAMQEAGALAKGYFDRVATLTIKSKGLQDVVSEADVSVEKYLKAALAERFPDDAFFGEETGLSEIGGRRGIWVCDPIDGTQPFLSGMRSWCVSLAYVHDGVLQFGFVFAPADGEIFSGGIGRPALLNGEPIVPHAGKTIRDGIVSVGYSTRLPPDLTLGILTRLLRGGGMYHRNGSGALCLCYVACGRLLGYVEAHINSWDCLGAIAVVESAGGRVNDFLVGDALKEGNRIIAGPPAVFGELVGLMD